MRGKAGPKPEMKVTSESGVTVIEEPFLDEPTAEEIVGISNVVDVGSVADELEEEELKSGYMCSNCEFRSPTLTGMEEHVAETGHGRAPVGEAVQPKLFSTPGVIHKYIDVPLDPVLLNQKRSRLAELYQQALDVKGAKKAADTDFNAQLAQIDEFMQEIARVLRHPNTQVKTDCEWRILEGENARGLFRLDTGEMIGDKEPLSMEDKISEEAKAAADNKEPFRICKVCNEEATAQIDGVEQYVCDRHALEGDVVRRLK